MEKTSNYQIVHIPTIVKQRRRHPSNRALSKRVSATPVATDQTQLSRIYPRANLCIRYSARRILTLPYLRKPRISIFASKPCFIRKTIEKYLFRYLLRIFGQDVSRAVSSRIPFGSIGYDESIRSNSRRVKPRALSRPNFHNATVVNTSESALRVERSLN